MTPERREEIAQLFAPEWSGVQLVYCVGNRDLMDAWRLTWQKLKLAIPQEMGLLESRHGLLRFTVRRQEMFAEQMLSGREFQVMRFPQHALEALSVSLDDALKVRGGEVTLTANL